MSSSISLQALRAANQAQEQAEKRAEIRRKSILILVHHYLNEEGYPDAAKTLALESKLQTENFSVCDSVSLPSVIEQFESWHHSKFERFPRFAKRVLGSQKQPKPHKCTNGHSSTENNSSNSSSTNSVSPGRRKGPFIRKRSLTPHGSTLHSNSMGRSVSDPSLGDDPGGISGASVGRITKIDSRKHDDIGKKSLLGRRGRESAKKSSPDDEKKDSSKSSSDTDSEKGLGNLTPFLPNGRKQPGPHQILDLKAMIRDYTRLENNIGDIGKGPRKSEDKTDSNAKPEEQPDDLYDDKSVKPPLSLSMFTGEMRELANSIQREILVENPGVYWSDILGVEDAKRLVKEAVVYPLKYPKLFVGRFKPWRGILLYGPPGTGKTLLAKAVATECNTTFFNISATTLVSKWRGDSEKLVRVLFEMARYHAPSTIFVDEVDALMGSRQGDGEHEASRRMKTQLLVELDGLTRDDDRVFMLAASNIPWELDPALLRRLEKRILVGLPDKKARSAMYAHNLPHILPDLEEAGQIVETKLEYNELAELSFGYSGSDIQIVCREAAMSCLRKIFNVLEDHSVDDTDLPDLSLDTIVMDDVKAAIQRTRPATDESDKYIEWHKKYGSA